MYWVLCRPTSNLCVIISRPESRQARMLIEEPAREAERLEPGIGVHCDVAELVVVHALDNRTSRCVDHQSRAAEMIRDDPVRDAGLDHVIWHVGLGAVDEAGKDGAAAIQFSHGVQLVLIQEPLNENTVDLFPDRSVLAIDYIVNLHPTR